MPAVYPRLWRFCASLTWTRDQAEDLAQATCLRALEKHESFEAGTHLDRWLFTIARRIWLNELRSQAVRQGEGVVSIDEWDIEDKNFDVEANIMASQLLKMIGALPEAQRATVMLVYVEGMRYREAAEVLEVPIGTIMSRLAAARKTLARQMESGRQGDET